MKQGRTIEEVKEELLRQQEWNASSQRLGMSLSSD